MGFGVRIMPGVRVRVSKRGIRTSIGPRIARVHVGAGRTGFSTGVGPFSYGTSGGSYRRSSGSRTYSGPQMSLSQMEKILQASKIENRLAELTKAHQVKFPVSQRIIAGRAQVPTVEEIQRVIFREKTKGTSIFARAIRKTLKEESQLEAQSENIRLDKEEVRKQNRAQKVLDEEWELLTSNSPELVVNLLAEAFGDNEATATPISVNGDTADILLFAPDQEIVPSKTSGTTPTGRVSVRQMKNTERKEIYFDIIFSHAIATANETFAVAPGLKKINLVLIRNEANKKLGRNQIACIGFGQIEKDLLEAQTFSGEPFSIFLKAAPGWCSDISNNLEFKALDLKNEPAVSQLIRGLNEDGK